jgi:LuxR family maltose regulon positive regulatory protein
MYLTLARIAATAGDESRAFDLLRRMQVIGDDRRLPRLSLFSLGEQIRMHAAARHAQSAMQMVEQLERCGQGLPSVAEPTASDGSGLVYRMGRACAQFAAHDAAAARITLTDAVAIASRINHGRDLLACRALLAAAMPPRDSQADDILREVLSIAQANGFVRLCVDTLPTVVDRVRQFANGRDADDLGASAAFVAQVLGESAAIAAPKPALAPSAGAKGAALALLTAKEATMLEHLARGMTNKEIARALGIGTETIKWHLKNVFAKLNAGSRRHAVDRARMLGLI